MFPSGSGLAGPGGDVLTALQDWSGSGPTDALDHRSYQTGAWKELAPLNHLVGFDATRLVVQNCGSGPLLVALTGTPSVDAPVAYTPASAGAAIAVGTQPEAIAITPDGATAYVCNSGAATVTPIALSNNTAGTAIAVGTTPLAIAITPNGDTAYVCNYGSNTVTPIALSNNTAGTAIAVGIGPKGIAITPDGTAAYVCNDNGNSVSVIDVATNAVTATIAVANNPIAIAITPNGDTAYVLLSNTDTVQTITIATNALGTPFGSFAGELMIAISPDGDTAYINATAGLIPVTLSNEEAGAAIAPYNGDFVLSPNGDTAYTVDGDSIVPVTLATGAAGDAIPIGAPAYTVGVTPTGATLYVVSFNGGTVTPVNAPSSTAGAITYGGYDFAVLAGFALNAQIPPTRRISMMWTQTFSPTGGLVEVYLMAGKFAASGPSYSMTPAGQFPI